MNAPTNTSRGDLIDALSLIQGVCNLVLQREDGGDHQLAETIKTIITGTVTVTEEHDRGLPPT